LRLLIFKLGPEQLLVTPLWHTMSILDSKSVIEYFTNFVDRGPCVSYA